MNNLRILDACGHHTLNTNRSIIGDDGIKDLNLVKLYVDFNSNITNINYMSNLLTKSEDF